MSWKKFEFYRMPTDKLKISLILAAGSGLSLLPSILFKSLREMLFLSN